MMFTRLAYLFAAIAFVAGFGKASVHLLFWFQSRTQEFNLDALVSDLITLTPIGIPPEVYSGLWTAMAAVAVGTLAEMHRTISGDT